MTRCPYKKRSLDLRSHWGAPSAGGGRGQGEASLSQGIPTLAGNSGARGRLLSERPREHSPTDASPPDFQPPEPGVAESAPRSPWYFGEKPEETDALPPEVTGLQF